MNKPKPQLRWTQICRIGKPLGLRGDFYIREHISPLSSDLKRVFIGESPNSSTPTQVVQQRKHKGKDVLRVSLCSDRTELEPYINSKLWIQTNSSPNILHFKDKSIDPTGWNITDSSNESFGSITELSNFGGGDFVTIETKDKLLLDLPIIDDYIKNISEEKQTLYLTVERNFFAELFYS